MNDEQQQELYRAIVINPFKESDDHQDLEALKQSAIDLYNDIISALNEAENESEEQE